MVVDGCTNFGRVVDLQLTSKLAGTSYGVGYIVVSSVGNI